MSKKAPRSVEFNFLLIAIDRDGFHKMKEEGQIYKTLPQIFEILPWDLLTFPCLLMILPRFHSDSLDTLLYVRFAIQNLEFYEWKLGDPGWALS